MRRAWLPVLTTLVCLATQPCIAAQPPAVPDPTTDVIDEIVVRGARLRDLRAAIVAAQDRFYARYNDVNQADEFDIDCAEDIHTGQRIPQRRCFTKVQREAMAQNGREVVEMFQHQAMSVLAVPGLLASEPGPTGMTAAGRPPNTDPQVVWLARYAEYRQNMLYLLKAHPDLERMARDAEKAQRRYDGEYKRRLKGRLLSIE